MRAILRLAAAVCILSRWDVIAQNGIQIQQVTPPVLHGEGPHWDCGQNMLYFVDITGQSFHRFDPASKDVQAVHFDGPVSPIIPVLGTLDQFVVGVGRDVVLVTIKWGAPGTEPNVTEPVPVLATVDEDKPGNRFNDGKADKKGRMWIGTMGPEPTVGNVLPGRGSLYRLAAGSASVRGSEHPDVTRVLTDVDISNGLEWNDIQTLMYYIDTPKLRVDVFDFDLENGTIANRRPVFDFKKNNVTGFPDGMTIDSDGNLWVACFGGSQVVKIDPVRGRLLQRLPIPASRVTSVVFGGKNLEVLYVTTSRFGLSEDELEKEPGAGSVFAVTGLGVVGRRPGNRKAVVRK